MQRSQKFKSEALHHFLFEEKNFHFEEMTAVVHFHPPPHHTVELEVQMHTKYKCKSRLKYKVQILLLYLRGRTELHCTFLTEVVLVNLKLKLGNAEL